MCFPVTFETLSCRSFQRIINYPNASMRTPWSKCFPNLESLSTWPLHWRGHANAGSLHFVNKVLEGQLMVMITDTDRSTPRVSGSNSWWQKKKQELKCKPFLPVRTNRVKSGTVWILKHGRWHQTRVPSLIPKQEDDSKKAFDVAIDIEILHLCLK